MNKNLLTTTTIRRNEAEALIVFPVAYPAAIAHGFFVLLCVGLLA